MCNKFFSNLVSDLGRSELLEVKAIVDARLKAMKPFRIMEVFKTCGKKDCSCREDYDQRHGPYLIASFGQGGKQKQKSLGKRYLQAEFNGMSQGEMPDWIDFIISSGELKRVKREIERYERGWVKRSLNSDEFKRFYGIPFGDDLLKRPFDLHYSRRRFEIAVARWRDAQEVAESEFVPYGVGTKKGVYFLRGLIEKGYYLANDAIIVEF